MYFVRSQTRSMDQTQQNLQNECRVKIDQTARVCRLMSIFTTYCILLLPRVGKFIIRASSSDKQMLCGSSVARAALTI